MFPSFLGLFPFFFGLTTFIFHGFGIKRWELYNNYPDSHEGHVWDMDTGNANCLVSEIFPTILETFVSDSDICWFPHPWTMFITLLKTITCPTKRVKDKSSLIDTNKCLNKKNSTLLGTITYPPPVCDTFDSMKLLFPFGGTWKFLFFIWDILLASIFFLGMGGSTLYGNFVNEIHHPKWVEPLYWVLLLMKHGVFH